MPKCPPACIKLQEKTLSLTEPEKQQLAKYPDKKEMLKDSIIKCTEMCQVELGKWK